MIQTMLNFAIDIAVRAGALLRERLHVNRDIALKSPFELVTDADHASEALIVDALKRQFPHHAILAEEGGGAEAEHTWLIDPLDGTNNYAHGFPFFAVSLTFVRNRAPLLGVIYDPIRDELFSAIDGQGSYCNGRRIHVSKTSTLAASLVSTGFPYDFATTDDNNLRQFGHIQARCQGVRRAGSAALDLAYVAAGRADAYWELRLKPWDTAAGALLVAEAGGRVSDVSGNPWDPWRASIFTSNGVIHQELLAQLNE